MRPAYLRPSATPLSPRPENPVLRAGRQADYDLHRMRPIDALALCIGYGLLLSMCVAGLISFFDWLDGRPQSVLPQLAALLARLD